MDGWVVLVLVSKNSAQWSCTRHVLIYKVITHKANLLSFGRHPSNKCNGFINPLCNFHARCHSFCVAFLVGFTFTFSAASDGVRMVELLVLPYLFEPRIMLLDWVVGVMEREWRWCGCSSKRRRMGSRRIVCIMTTMMCRAQRNFKLPSFSPTI